jgi:hypothetical protein
MFRERRGQSSTIIGEGMGRGWVKEGMKKRSGVQNKSTIVLVLLTD